MTNIELMNALMPNTDIDIDLHNSMEKVEDVVVELADESYVEIDSVFFIHNKTVIRLKNKK